MVRSRNLGVKIGHYVQLHVHRVAAVHVVVVFTRPKKRFFVGANFQTFQINVVLLENINHAFGKIAAHDRHQIVVFCEIRSRKRNERSGTADDFVGFAKRRFERVESNRTYGKKTHKAVIEGFMD